MWLILKVLWYIHRMIVADILETSTNITVAQTSSRTMKIGPCTHCTETESSHTDCFIIARQEGCLTAFKCYWSLFLMIHLTTIQHWFMECLWRSLPGWNGLNRDVHRGRSSTLLVPQKRRVITSWPLTSNGTVIVCYSWMGSDCFTVQGCRPAEYEMPWLFS